MKKCTDLNSLKEVAGCLLYTDVHRVENYPFLVKHPFTDSAFAAIAKNPEKVTENKVINILESEEDLMLMNRFLRTGDNSEKFFSSLGLEKYYGKAAAELKKNLKEG